MTWSCIAVKKRSASANKSAFVSHLFDASMSTYCWLRPYEWQPCKAFWDHCLLTLLLYSSSVGNSFAFVQTKSSGVHLSSAFTNAAWRDDVTCLFKKYYYYYLHLPYRHLIIVHLHYYTVEIQYSLCIVWWVKIWSSTTQTTNPTQANTMSLGIPVLGFQKMGSPL